MKPRTTRTGTVTKSNWYLTDIPVYRDQDREIIINDDDKRIQKKGCSTHKYSSSAYKVVTNQDANFAFDHDLSITCTTLSGSGPLATST